MTKLEMVREVGKKANVKQDDVCAVLDSYAEVVLGALKKSDDEKVPLPGIGNFKVKSVKERERTLCVGNRKGEKYVTPAHKDVTFKVSRTVKTLE